MPSPASTSPVPVGQGTVSLSPKETNAYRLAVVADALFRNALAVPCGNTTMFRDLSIGLARLIDFAVTNDHKPVNSPRLSHILKQVCQHKKESTLQASIMVLLISVKNACKLGWFSAAESEELLCLVDEVSKSFCTPRDAGADQTFTTEVVSQIMSRFYPWFKLGHIIASLEVKPGFGAHLVDFLIPNDVQLNQDEKIRLLVAAVDNIDTSSCIISPNEVDFLVNGRGVEKRTTTYMDPGPQLPTAVEPLLKYGANLLQAVGRFDGRYVILLACMSYAPVHDIPAPIDYVQPAHPVVDTDDDIIEGPSQIKLTCPISFTRISCPAKGYMCKHHQCFDFTNYMKINISRPSWRCPLCNQSVCYTDIRIDRNMWKILQDVEENVVEVIVSEDGSWKTASGRSNHTNEAEGRSSASQQDATGQLEMFLSSSDGQQDIYDLTELDDNSNVDDWIVDSKPALGHPSPNTSATPVNGTMPPFGTTSGISQSTSTSQVGSAAGDVFRTTSVLTDSVTSIAPNLGQRTFEGQQRPIYGHGSHPSRPAATPMSGFPVNNGYPPGHARNFSSSQPITMGNNSPSQGDLLQQLPPIPRIMFQRPPATTQITGHTTPVQAPRIPSPHVRNPINYGSPSMVSAPPHLRSSRHHIQPNAPLSERMAQTAHQVSMWSRHLQNYPVRAPTTSGQASLSASPRSLESGRMSQSAASQSRQPPQNYQVRTPMHGQAPLSAPRSLQSVRTTSGGHGPAAASAGVQSVTRMEDLMSGQPEQNQRPSGRMRGSLSIAQVDAGALSQQIIRPTNLGSAPPRSNSTAPHLRALSQPVVGEGGVPAPRSVAPHLRTLSQPVLGEGGTPAPRSTGM